MFFTEYGCVVSNKRLQLVLLETSFTLDAGQKRGKVSFLEPTQAKILLLLNITSWAEGSDLSFCRYTSSCGFQVFFSKPRYEKYIDYSQK